MIRKAEKEDIQAIAEIYGKILAEEEQGRMAIGWVRGVYPTQQTALDALARGDLFVEVEGDGIVAAAIINQIQVPEYDHCPWEYQADASQVMVLHTLVVDPEESGKGYGRRFVEFYEDYALARGCHCLRMDTQVKNKAARAMYGKLGYREAGVVGCVFNGIAGVQLVCLEKKVSCTFGKKC